MKKMAVLFNPSSGKGRAFKQKRTIMRHLASGNLDIDFIVTESETHLRSLAAEVVRTPGRYDAIVGVGGDTTFNIIATEMLRNGNGAKNGLPLGMIGTGSANDITRGLGLETIAGACRAIINGNIKKMDVGYATIGQEKLFFLGTLSLGLGVTVNRYVEDFVQRHKFLSRWKPFDQLAPALYAIYDSFAKKRIPLRMDLEYLDRASGEKIKLPVEFSLLVLLNTPFYANGLQLGQDNGLFDGLLDGCIIDTQSFSTTLRCGLQILRKKKLSPTDNADKMNNVTFLQSTRFKISSPENINIQVDGKIFVGIKELEISLVPGGLDIFSNCLPAR